MFLDISKAFNKVWHEDFIFKLTQNGIRENLLELLADFLEDRKLKVVLNGQVSNWSDVTTEVTQASIIGPLLFLIYINDLATSLSSNAKLFADDTSLFSVTHDINTSANELNNDFAKINNWAFQWKLNFNLDPIRQAKEAIFSRKLKKISHPPLFFSNIQVLESSSQKHLGIILDKHPIFCEYLKIES